jgi:hypothetical protein
MLVDISPLGAGVTFTGSLDSTAVRLALGHGGRHATLAGRVVSQRYFDGRCTVSVVFEGLNPVQREFVDGLYDHYRTAFLEALPLAG